MDPRLLRLLHWSLAQQGQSSSGDSSSSGASAALASGTSGGGERTLEEKRKDVEWLMKAMSDMAPVIDPVDQMKLLVDIVKDSNAPAEKREEALYELA